VKTDDLIAEVGSLPVEERVRVADEILRSLNPPDSDIDRKWAEVAQRRLAELRTGKVQSAPGDEVFARIWKRFGT
jgi:putative addiction module component (TIGR02574 family)